MPDETRPTEQGAHASGEPATPEHEAPAAANGKAARPDANGPDARIADLQKERDGLKDQLLRALAETDNLRKRAERENADTAKYAIARFAQDIVGVGDSFQHAVAAVPPGAADKDPALKSFLEGVTLAEKAFIAALEKHGVTRIDPVGEAFSPFRHHAVSEEQNAGVAPGSVTKVYQVGYALDDRVLRPAMVVVAKGGKKAAPEAKGESPAPEPSADGEGETAHGPETAQPPPEGHA